MPDLRGSRVFSSASHNHTCNDDCMLSSDEEDCKSLRHPLRQNPPSIYDEHYDEVLLAPSPALTSDRSTCYSPRPPSPIEDFPTIPTRNGHQRSWTSTFKLPPLVAQTASRASLHSPTKTLSNWISSQSFPQEAPPTSPSKQRANPLADWFTGTSAPVQFGIASSPSRRDSLSPTRSPDDYLSSSEMVEAYTSRPGRLRRSSTATTNPGTAGLTSKLWGLTKSITTASTAPIRAAASDPPDELLNLDINHALLPLGIPDILAPSSFHDLLSNAEAALVRYQAAYRHKCAALSELQLEKSAQQEELEEAETRARHLKMQLDGMAAKAKEQEEAMRALSLELLAERRRREDEDQTRKKSLKLVYKDERMRRERGSSGASVSNSDSGFESDADNARDDVSIDSTSSTLAEEDFPRERGRPALSTYDKVLKTVAGEPASAWAVMEGYREENRMLRGRVHELEGAVDAALDLVGGLGI